MSGEEGTWRTLPVASIQPHRGQRPPAKKRPLDYVAGRMTNSLTRGRALQVHPHFYITWALHNFICILCCVLAFLAPLIAAAIILSWHFLLWRHSTRSSSCANSSPRAQHHVSDIEARARRKRWSTSAHLDAGQMV